MLVDIFGGGTIPTAGTVSLKAMESLLLLLTFSGLLLFVSGQKSLYLDLLRGLKHPSVKEKSLASV